MTDISNTYDKPTHPIKVVATRTGLSKDVIRVWEKRYQVIQPERSDTGRQLCADADIEHLLKLKQATSGSVMSTWQAGRKYPGKNRVTFWVQSVTRENQGKSPNNQLLNDTSGVVWCNMRANGQNQEMGEMMAAVAAAVAGWRAIYMLPGLPAREILATATKNPARRPGL